MREPTMIRKGHQILSTVGVLLRDCKTINAAKRHSRELQKQGEVIRVEQHKRQAPHKQVARAPSRLQRIRAQEKQEVRVTKKRRHNWKTADRAEGDEQ